MSWREELVYWYCVTKNGEVVSEETEFVSLEFSYKQAFTNNFRVPRFQSGKPIRIRDFWLFLFKKKTFDSDSDWQIIGKQIGEIEVSISTKIC